MKPLAIQITYDFICPWCWIGHRHLKIALAQAGADTAAAVQYLPYELNPYMPKEGADRKAYRSAKFGSWARSQAMDADVTQAGKSAGVEFHYDRVSITPNTRQAHRLMFFAASKGDASGTEALFEAIFHAYFSEGLDIGKADVLVELASQAGFDAAELQAQVDGVRSVPTLRVGGTPISGAQPPAVFAQALRQAMATQATKALTA